MGYSTTELYSNVLAAVLPLLIALVQRPTWSSRRRAIVAFLTVWLFTTGFQVGAVALGGGLDAPARWPVPSEVAGFIRMLVVNLVIVATCYKSLWTPLGVAGSIETATSPPSRARTALELETERLVTPPRAPGH